MPAIITDKDLHLNLVEIDREAGVTVSGRPGLVSEQSRRILNHIAHASAFELKAMLVDNSEPYNVMLAWAEKAIGVKKPDHEYLGYAIQEIVEGILHGPKEGTEQGDERLISKVKALVEQADAQKKAGDKYLSVSFTDVEELRKLL